MMCSLYGDESVWVQTWSNHTYIIHVVLTTLPQPFLFEKLRYLLQCQAHIKEIKGDL
jgi:hypothetical protein